MAMIEDYLDDQELVDLAEYCKRMTYEDAYHHAEGEGEYRKAKAYRYIDAVANERKVIKKPYTRRNYKGEK
jgi:hypothetical protein